MERGAPASERASRRAGFPTSAVTALIARTGLAGLVGLLGLVGLAVAGCSGSGGDAADGSTAGSDGGAEAAQALEAPSAVVVANTPGTLGRGVPQRVMTALVGDGANAYLGGPDQPVTIRFTPLDAEGETDLDAAEGGADGAGEVEGEWLTTNATALGLYVTGFTFETAGPWRVTASSGGRELGSTVIEVVEDPVVPGIGDPVPPSATPTAAEPDEIAAISSDPDPDRRLYRLSIAEAVADGRPTVVAFATPAFCQTALCGPTLEFVKGATAGRDDLDVVHVEPYDLELAREGALEPIPTMAEWGLVTEPWVFVLDADGRVVASFEGIIGQDELEWAIDQL